MNRKLKISFPLSSPDISFILVLPYFFAPSRSKLVSRLSSWVRASTSQGCAHPRPPSQPPFGKGGRWIVLREKGGWGLFFWEGWVISQELILFKLKTAPSPSNLLLSQSRTSLQAASTYSLALVTNMELTWDLFLLLIFNSLLNPVCSTTKVPLKSVHLAISPLPTLRHHWSNVHANWKKEPLPLGRCWGWFHPTCHLCTACDLPNLA